MKSLPEKVNAGIYYSLPVRPYIPAPLRCFNCQKFGHSKNSCDKEPTCVCGKALHVGTTCTEPVNCVNCGGEHFARSKNCPIFKEEAAIQKIKVLEKVPYVEAKRKVKASASPTFGSYATVAARNTSSTINIKEIITQMIPEIIKICTELIEKNKLNKSSLVTKPSPLITQPSTFPPQTRKVYTKPVTRTCASDSSTQSRDKRKASKSPSEEESDESPPQETEERKKKTKRKPGWPKGKPRKPPEYDSEQSSNTLPVVIN
ncbi:hypothetical protein NQ314_009708 [Rhamnusium bicolor]|uniref:CCHC-type domain-containing protein n=1 Tax=Rhamnusium bicolor TaxID=1586634 RepID=A0AAV8XYG6_9CUCU|nr:hypothetical protein NQ314_009708 [Rhamnusium bicolor]